jgi:hypothetical protein
MATLVLVFSLAGFLWSGPTAGPRLQGRLAAAAIEIDRWLPAHEEDIRANARERPRASIEVNDLPIAVSIDSLAAESQDIGKLKGALVAAMGQRLYDEGRSAYNGGGSISVAEPSRWPMDLLRPGPHHALQYLTLLFLAVCILGATLSAIGARGAPGAAVLRPVAFGAGAALFLAIGLWVLFRGGALLTEPTITGESLLVLRDFAAIAIRIAFAVCLGAGAILVLMNLTSSQPDLPAARGRFVGSA